MSAHRARAKWPGITSTSQNLSPFSSSTAMTVDRRRNYNKKVLPPPPPREIGYFASAKNEFR
jgi:hypothetical protein